MKVKLTFTNGFTLVIIGVEYLKLGGDRTVFTRTFCDDWVTHQKVAKVESSYCFDCGLTMQFCTDLR